MLLQRLHEYRQREDVDAKIPPAYHKRQDIKWILKLDVDGRFVAWIAADRTEPAPYRIRSGTKPPPYLLVDQYPYLLGDTLDESDFAASKAEMRWEMFVELIEELVDYTPKEERAPFSAVYDFITSEERQEALEHAPEDMGRKDLIGIEVDGQLVHQQSAARRYWTAARDEDAVADSRTTAECIVCGERKAIPRTQPVELKLGPNRVQLISANENAFESYGLKQSAISPVCQGCARSYGEAARFLMGSDANRYRTGDVTYIFWTREPVGLDAIMSISAPDEEHVRSLLKSVYGGSRSAADETSFYACAMTANTSRLVVRDYLETTVGDVKASLARWFKAQRLVDHESGTVGKPYGLYALAASLVRDANKDLPPSTIPTLLGAALYGRPIPPRILSQALGRARADTDNRLTRPRAMLIKMALNDLKQFSDDPDAQELKVTEDLNETEERPAYLCGRLIALLEEAQRAALGNVNSTIVDRYFGTASAAPASVFGRLLRGSQAHFQKLRKNNPGARENIERGVEEVMSKLASFPKTLTIEDQGLFAMGYYHQRADSRRRMHEAIEAKKADEAVSEAAAAAVTADAISE